MNEALSVSNSVAPSWCVPTFVPKKRFATSATSVDRWRLARHPRVRVPSEKVNRCSGGVCTSWAGLLNWNVGSGWDVVSECLLAHGAVSAAWRTAAHGIMI